MNNERLAAVDKLRVFAILGVILIHTTTRVLERSSYNLDTYWVTLLLNQIVRFAVPLFFFISGFVLELTYKNTFSFGIYLKKRFSKIFIPYIFWSLIYYYFVYTSNHNHIINVLLTGSASYQLYFIPSLCIFYMIFPLLHKIYKYISYPLVIYILVILVITQIYILHQDYFVRNFQFSDSLRISILGLFFFLSGMIASHHKDVIFNFSTKVKVVLGILTAFLAYYIFREGATQYIKTYNINAFYSSWRPSTLLYTFISGAFLINILTKIDFSKLSRLSFMVFFIHTLFIEIVWNMIGKFVSPYFYFDLLFFISVTGLSFLVSGLIHKIPGLSKITG